MPSKLHDTAIFVVKDLFGTSWCGSQVYTGGGAPCSILASSHRGSQDDAVYAKTDQ